MCWMQERVQEEGRGRVGMRDKGWNGGGKDGMRVNSTQAGETQTKPDRLRREERLTSNAFLFPVHCEYWKYGCAFW